jgi:hypothetical protein
MSYFGAISLPWPFTVLAYAGTAIMLSVLSVFVVALLPDSGRTATAHHQHDHSDDADLRWWEWVLYSPLAAVFTVVQLGARMWSHFRNRNEGKQS